MSTDLLDQLAQYGADHRARQAPVDRQEILARVSVTVEPGDQPPRSTAPGSSDEKARPRRWLLLAAAAASVALVGGLVLLSAGRDASEPSDVPGTDFIRSTEPPAPASSIAGSPTPTSSATSTSVPTSQPEAAPEAVPKITASASAVEPTRVVGSSFREGSRSVALGAWKEGFLFTSIAGGVQSAVELSPEMYSRFPPEVRAAYPDQLSGPLGEVITRLQQDGLLDEVQAALQADPELEAAVLSGPTTPIELVAEFSVDGDTWTPVEVSAPPDMEVEEVFIVGSRLVAVGMPPAGLAPSPFRTMIVASTENLEDWSVQSVPDVVETLAEVSIAANDDGWVAHIEPDLCRIHPSGGAECGSLPTPSHGYDVGEGPPLTWAAVWGGVPTAIDGSVAEEGVTITATSHGFLAQHDEIEFSSDGVTWTTVARAPSGFSIEGAVPLDDGATVVFGFAPTCGTERYRVDASGQQWERIDLDIGGASPNLLPNTGRLPLTGMEVGTRSIRSSVALVDDSGHFVGTGVLEQDGLRLSRIWCSSGGRQSERYELVDTLTGVVLVAESRGDWTALDEHPFDHLTETDEVVTVADPVTGEELLTFDRRQMDVTEVGTGGYEQVWLFATSDGVEWAVDDLSDFAAGQRFFVTAARNGDVALVGSGDEWLRYQLPAS